MVMRPNSQCTVVQPDTIQEFPCIMSRDAGRKLNEGKGFLFSIFFINRNVNTFDRTSLENQNLI
jgi:hypothetical protein